MKTKLLFIFVLLFSFTADGATCAAAEKAKPVAPQVVIKIDADKVELNWTRLPGVWDYSVLISLSPDMTEPQVRVVVSDTFFIDTIPDDDYVIRFYSIIAHRPEDEPLDEDDYHVIESFEEPVVLTSYSEEEDEQPDGWQQVLDGSESEDGYSLELFGNTWKRQTIDPKQLVANEVWQLVIKTMSESRVQAIGVADSANEYWYQIWGDEGMTSECWNTAYAGWYPEMEWFEVDLPIAEDWFGSYGYLPRVLELLYANDNDEINEPGAFRIDEIRDMSPLIREPLPIEIEWLIEGYPSADSVDVIFSLTGLDSENPPVEYEWTLGDGTYEQTASFSHRYANDESYKVVLQYREYDGLTNWAKTEVVCGNGSSSRDFSFITTGDVMIARRYVTEGVIDEIGAEGIFDSIRATILDVDLAMCNLECPFTDWPHDHPTKEYTFKGLPQYLPAITYAGFDYCALGNNHNLDYMYPGMVETQFLLDSLELLSSGSGANDLIAREPAIFSKNGLSAAILSYCNRDGVEDNLQPYLSATRSRPGFAMWNRSQIEQTIPAAGELADLVIVQSHSGTEYATEAATLDEVDDLYSENITFELIPDTADVDLRRYAIDMGADIVINHHPHVIQGIETYNGKFIAHSMGNFAFDQRFPETFYSMVLRAKCSLSGGVSGLEVLPLYIQDYIPRRPRGYLAERLLDYISELSRPMSTVMVREPGELIGHVLNDSPYNPRTLTHHLSASFEQRDTLWVTAPTWIATDGYPARVTLPDSLSDIEMRVGRAVFWMGNFEDEGATPWLFNSDDEGLTEENVHSGSYCALITRPTGAMTETGTLMTYRIPYDVEKSYTAQGWMSTVNANSAALTIRYYLYRSSGANLSNQTIGESVDGTTPWTFAWEELQPHENTNYYNIWFSSSGRMLSAVEARFDDIEIIEWEPWQERVLEIPFPSNVTHVQFRTPNEHESVSFTTQVKWLPTSSSSPVGG